MSDKEKMDKVVMPCKVIVKTRDIFDNYVTTGITALSLKTFGYNTKGGGWSRYSVGMDDTPATFLVYKKAYKRKHSTININQIEAITKA